MKRENLLLNKGEISIILPSYNGAEYVRRMLDSVLNQTYKKFHLIFVNDGSTDETEQIVLCYKPLFEQVNARFTYCFQENQGQATAINLGLPFVDSEFFMWIDDDDFLESEHLEKKVLYLRNHPEKDLVRCKGKIYKENNLEEVVNTFEHVSRKKSLFEEILFGREAPTGGLYMVRTRSLFESLVKREIYTSPVGQNMQLLLPVAIKNKNGYINDYLFNYVIREDSHSHRFQGGIEWKQRWDDLEDMKRVVLLSIDMDEMYRKRLVSILDIQMNMIRFRGLDEKNESEQPEYIRELCGFIVQHTKLRENIGIRDIYLWGICKISERFCYFLEKCTDYKISGYIDSNRKKVSEYQGNKKAVYSDEVDKNHMYIMAFIKKHDEIVEKLEEKAFSYQKDYYYPEYEMTSLLDSR